MQIIDNSRSLRSQYKRIRGRIKSKELLKIQPINKEKLRASFDIYSTPGKTLLGGHGQIMHQLNEQICAKSPIRMKLPPIGITEEVLRERVCKSFTTKEDVINEIQNTVMEIRKTNPDSEMEKWLKLCRESKADDPHISKYIESNKNTIMKKTYGAKIRMTEHLTK